MLEDRSQDLYTAITQSGFYPGVATAEVRRLLAGDPVRASFVMTDLHLDSDDGMHMEGQVLAVADDRLVFWGAYEEPGEDEEPAVLRSHARVFPLRKISDLRVMSTVSNPATFTAEDVPDAVRVVFVLDQLDRVELEPLGCGDEDCGGGHGFNGELIPNALVFAETKEAAGERKLLELLELAGTASKLLDRRA